MANSPEAKLEWKLLPACFSDSMDEELCAEGLDCCCALATQVAMNSAMTANRISWNKAAVSFISCSFFKSMTESLSSSEYILIADHFAQHVNLLRISRQHVLRCDGVARMLAHGAARVRDCAINRSEGALESQSGLRIKLGTMAIDIARKNRNRCQILLLGFAYELIWRWTAHGCLRLCKGARNCSSPHRKCWTSLSLIPILSKLDRKSTRLNSSHANISYAVFCLKK